MYENCADMPKVVLTNSALLEIEAFCQKRNLEWKHLSRIVLILSNACDPSHITEDFLWHCISALQKKKEFYCWQKKLKNNELEQFLCSLFKLEKNIPKASLTIVKIVDNNNEKTEKLLAKI